MERATPVASRLAVLLTPPFLPPVARAGADQQAGRHLREDAPEERGEDAGHWLRVGHSRPSRCVQVWGTGETPKTVKSVEKGATCAPACRTPFHAVARRSSRRHAPLFTPSRTAVHAVCPNKSA
eukprot:scaffold26840_cov79-Isochrysis_galbana.AAC.1